MQLIFYTFLKHNLLSICLPSSVIEIGESAFMDCDSLLSIDLPNGLSKIGDGAFNNCTNLISITLPKSVLEIGQFAFAECDNLTNVKLWGANTHLDGGVFACLDIDAKPVKPQAKTIRAVNMRADDAVLYWQKPYLLPPGSRLVFSDTTLRY